jgi:hypothetical protein
MTPFFILLISAILLAALAWSLVNANPASIARYIKLAAPVVMMITGGLLALFGRAGVGIPLAVIGFTWAMRNRNVGPMQGSNAGHRSTVRSAWLEMELDHDTGDLEGQILTGPLEGKQLAELDETVLLELYRELRSDPESAGLMEAYLDRRIPAWRDDAQGDSATGQGETAGAGPMSKQEAYQVLGLDEGATAAEIKAAHRRLMKAVHPDSGGSTFLAARINEAKDMLLD